MHLEHCKALLQQWSDEIHQLNSEAAQNSSIDPIAEGHLTRKAAELIKRQCELDIAIMHDEIDAIESRLTVAMLNRTGAN